MTDITTQPDTTLVIERKTAQSCVPEGLKGRGRLSRVPGRFSLLVGRDVYGRGVGGTNADPLERSHRWLVRP